VVIILFDDLTQIYETLAQSLIGAEPHHDVDLGQQG
jgi:hypothetical protein